MSRREIESHALPFQGIATLTEGMDVDVSFGVFQHGGQSVLKHADKRILLIEDSRMFSTALKYGLESAHGITVTHCASLGALQLQLEREPSGYALAVLDLNLPDAPNGQALDFVISNNIPAIVFTGAFNDRTRDDVLNRAVIGCIIKDRPESIGQLILLVDRVLTASRTGLLLVDADPVSRATLADHLQRRLFPVTQAADGAEALALIAGGLAVDVVITGMDIGDMDGHTLLQHVRRQAVEDMVAVIGLADAAQAFEAAAFLDKGGNEFITRPYALEEFDSRLFQVARIHSRVQALRRVAARDYLTDLFNRRYFFEIGPRLVERCLQRGTGSCIAIFDIDHFKRLNDTYGHEVGDLVLKAVARRLRMLVGDVHLLARLGGEEFGILFSDLSIEAAGQFCDNLRIDISRTKVIADDEEISITISIGLALIADRESFDNYLNAADQFLYMAKSAGRNCVMSENKMLLLAAS